MGKKSLVLAVAHDATLGRKRRCDFTSDVHFEKTNFSAASFPVATVSRSTKKNERGKLLAMTYGGNSFIF